MGESVLDQEINAPCGQPDRLHGSVSVVIADPFSVLSLNGALLKAEIQVDAATSHQEFIQRG
jgi:hypothetical protein